VSCLVHRVRKALFRIRVILGETGILGSYSTKFIDCRSADSDSDYDYENYKKYNFLYDQDAELEFSVPR